LHALQHLLLLEVNPVLLEARFSEHFAQNGQTFLEIFGEQIKAYRTFRAADVRRQLRGEKSQPFLKFLRRARGGARACEQGTAKIGESFLAIRLDPVASANVHGDAHQRELVVRHDVGHRTDFERHAVRFSFGWLKFEWRKLQLLGTVGNVNVALRECRRGNNRYGADNQ
jgi:hypothetical protein